MKPLVCCFFFAVSLLVPTSALAAVTINEIAWPHTNFAVLLCSAWLLVGYFFVRTKGSPSWCLGKPSTNIFHEEMLVLGKMGLIVFLFLPSAVHGAVVINEIAWMGSKSSANDEWIELYNIGDASVSLAGWTLTDQNDLVIELSGALPTGAYGVLERTDDTSAPGSAFLLYTGALANTGATLTLRDSSNAIVDQVAGGEDWEAIGGNNETKDTAQYSAQGWITAAPTPGAENATEPSPTPKTEERSDGDSRGISSGTARAPVREVDRPRTLVPSTKQLELSITAPEVIYVNQPATFVAKPANIGETITDSLQYQWNFGDLHTATGERVEHTFAYPGQYLLTLHATYARHDEIYQTEVTVLPVTFSLTQNADGDVQIHNNSPYEVDVSGFSLAGEESVTFPPLSFIAPNGTVTIPKERIADLRLGQAQLFDRDGARLAALTDLGTDSDAVDPAPAQRLATRPSPATVAAASPNPSAATERFAFAESAATATRPTTTDALAVVRTTPDQTASSNRPTSNARLTAAARDAGTTLPDAAWPLIGLTGVIAVGLVGLYLGSQKS